MDLLLPLAAKSFVIAGGVLLLLKLADRRSASDRSWIAHLGLAAVLALPIAAFALPAIQVEGPAFLTAPAIEAPELVTAAAPSAPQAAAMEAAPSAARFPAEAAAPAASVDWGLWAYLAPAALLLLLTLIALARLVTLKARATVLVEPHWLSALAHAQRRMGFKNGTALLTSDDLPSPISWGLMRPVILLNSDAANSHKEAEAIIAHELAHVANLDWAKLLLARVTVAMFWFNPFVWLLAREAHQLREEAADDAVLGADIEDTDYARLLVGVARHECRGLLIGAHGVAPAKNSLSRRVRRVLDGALARAPGGWRWSTAAAFFAAGMAVPIALLNFVPTTPASAAASGARATPAASANAVAAASPEPKGPYYAGSAEPAAGLSEIIGNAVEASVAGTIGVVGSNWSDEDERDLEKEIEKSVEKAWDHKGPRPGTVGPRPGTVGPKRRGAGVDNALDLAIAMKAVGVTPAYIRSMRAAIPYLSLTNDDFIEMKAVGVTPEVVRDLSAAGFRNLSSDELVQAAALRLTSQYVRGIAAAGYRGLSLDDYSELRAVGVTPDFIERLRRGGHRPSVQQLIGIRALGIRPEDVAGLGHDGS